ncbi:MAG: tail fiber domain-containing protein [Desulfobacterales bacterium]|nr:tail fiber domain-containing protein [Desulfobacterales bacterium]
MKKSRLVSFVVFGCQLSAMLFLLASVVSAGSVPYSFSSGSLIKSSDMNSNFSWLAERAWEKNESNLYFNSGNVGLGTSSPERKFHLVGTTNAAQIRMTNSVGVIGDIGVSGVEGGSIYETFQIGSESNHSLRIYTKGGNGTNIWLLPDGNTGIGTRTPSQKLTVAGTIESTTGGFKFPDGTIQSTAATGSSTSTSTTSTGWTESGGNIYRTGNVGIGTTNPEKELHIFSTTNDAEIRISNNVGVIGDIGVAGSEGGANYASFQIATQTNHPLILGANGGSSKVVIGKDGNVGFNRGVDQISYPIHMASGAHVTTGGVWTDASSREYKQDIEELTSETAFEAFKQLKPVRYAYKVDETEKHVGFIAEDVPDLVATNDRKSLSPMDIVALMTKVVQEQAKTIDELSERLKTLENKQ